MNNLLSFSRDACQRILREREERDDSHSDLAVQA
jgi:hypothetical protein